MKKNGKLKMIYRDRENTKPIACEIEIVLSQEHIDYMRSVYTKWWAALDKLCRMLWENDALVTSFNVLPPASAKQPWV